MAEKIDDNEPHNQEKRDHKDGLDFAHASVEAAGRDSRDKEEASLGKIADFAVCKTGTSFVDASLELLVEIFAQKTDKDDVGDSHDCDEREKGFPMFENELESCHGVA